MKTSMITATAAITIISTFVMAVFANLPLVVAPGLGALSPAHCTVFVGCCCFCAQNDSSTAVSMVALTCRTSWIGRHTHFRDKLTSSVFTAGLNAYFTFNVVGFHGSGNVPYKTALACIFIEGVRPASVTRSADTASCILSLALRQVRL